MKYVSLAVVILANVVLAFRTLAPALATYAEKPPPGITCDLCGTPEVQRALISAAAYGSYRITHMIYMQAPWTLGIALLNVIALALALFVRGRSRSNYGRRSVS